MNKRRYMFPHPHDLIEKLECDFVEHTMVITWYDGDVSKWTNVQRVDGVWEYDTCGIPLKSLEQYVGVNIVNIFDKLHDEWVFEVEMEKALGK